MNKKLISAAMAGLLMMTGCSGTNATSKSASQSGEKTTVEFWYAGGKTAVGVIQDIVDKYNESQDKYEVKTVTQADYDETYQKLQAAIAGNSAPDLVLLNPNSARTLDEKNLLADLFVGIITAILGIIVVDLALSGNLMRLFDPRMD